MAAQILKLRQERFPAAHLIGKRYQNYGDWAEWQANNWFALLASVQALAVNKGGWIGAKHVVDGTVEYWIGRLCPPDTEAPDGFASVEIPSMEYAVFHIYGQEERDRIFSFDMHNLCLRELEQYGLTRKEDDWCLEQHLCPNRIPDEQGNMVYEYAVSIEI